MDKEQEDEEEIEEETQEETEEEEDEDGQLFVVCHLLFRDKFNSNLPELFV